MNGARPAPLPPTLATLLGLQIAIVDGETVYTFEGHIDADGVDIPVGVDDTNSVRWFRPDDSTAGQLYIDGTGQAFAALEARPLAAEHATIVLRAGAGRAPGARAELHVVSYGDAQPNEVRATAGGLNVLIIDENGLSSFLLATGKAADSHLLDGLDSTAFLLVGAKAADSNLLDGLDSTAFRLVATAIQRADLATVTRKEMLVIAGLSQLNGPGVAFPDAATNNVHAMAVIPDDYDSGALTWKVRLRSTVAAGTAKIFRSIHRLRSGAAIATFENLVAQDFTPGNTNTQEVSGVFAAANFQAGDVIRFDWQRQGAHASDNLGGTVAYDGAWLEYTGRA